MSEDIELFPCPFCGGKASYEIDNDGNCKELGCNDVNCAGYMAFILWISDWETDEEKNIISAWNTRTDQWIPVSERLPENDDSVLTYSDIEGYRVISRGSVNSVGNGFPCGVTHWQSLSQPKEI